MGRKGFISQWQKLWLTFLCPGKLSLDPCKSNFLTQEKKWDLTLAKFWQLEKTLVVLGAFFAGEKYPVIFQESAFVVVKSTAYSLTKKVLIS